MILSKILLNKVKSNKEKSFSCLILSENSNNLILENLISMNTILKLKFKGKERFIYFKFIQ